MTGSAPGWISSAKRRRTHNPAKTVQSYFGMSNPLQQPLDATGALGIEEQLRYARHLILPEIGLEGQKNCGGRACW